MILNGLHGDVELRAGEWTQEHIIPRPGSNWLSQAGIPVTTENAFGVPAVSAVIRGASEVIASLPFIVYEDAPIKERAPLSWQYRLLHDKPADDCDSFEFFYDLALSLEATQNAFVQKVKGVGSRRGIVEALYVLDPARMKVERNQDTGKKEFAYYGPNGVEKGIGTDQILHVRGFTPNPGALAGVSLIQMHRDPIASQIAMQKFEGDYFRNNATPPYFYTGLMNREHAKEARDFVEAEHAGVGRQWKPGFLWGGIDVKSIPMSMQDAMFIDAKQLAIEDACRIWRWPRSFVELRDEQQVVDRNARMADFLKINLAPRLRRIERALAADEDLFWGSGLFGEFLISALERADYVTRVRGYKDARQGGWITGNEIRALENYPPLPEGNELLATPVGGAPNPGSNDQGND